MKNELIELLVITETQDSDGFPIKTESAFECFADVQSAKRTEFYSAQTAGYKVELVCIVGYEDFKSCKVVHGKPTRVRIDDDVFKILREYRNKKNHSVELTLIEGD